MSEDDGFTAAFHLPANRIDAHSFHSNDIVPLLASFSPYELAALSSMKLSYLAAIDDTEDLPPGEDEESFSPDEWKELFIRFVECYEEAKTELAAKPRD